MKKINLSGLSTDIVPQQKSTRKLPYSLPTLEEDESNPNFDKLNFVTFDHLYKVKPIKPKSFSEAEPKSQYLSEQLFLSDEEEEVVDKEIPDFCWSGFSINTIQNKDEAKYKCQII